MKFKVDVTNINTNEKSFDTVEVDEAFLRYFLATFAKMSAIDVNDFVEDLKRFGKHGRYVDKYRIMTETIGKTFEFPYEVTVFDTLVQLTIIDQASMNGTGLNAILNWATQMRAQERDIFMQHIAGHGKAQYDPQPGERYKILAKKV